MSPLPLSLLVAGSATLLTLAPGFWAAYVLGVRRPFPGKALIETLLTLPLVLPPTVVGYGLLLLLGQGTAFGRWLNNVAGIRLIFTWEGAALAAAVMAFPLLVRTASSAFASVDTELLEMGRTLGASELRLFFSVLLPLAYRGLLAAVTLAFARALGEFGATLMVAGSTPGQTQTLPLALYAAMLGGHDDEARNYALVLTAVAFVALGLVTAYGGRVARARGERY